MHKWEWNKELAMKACGEWDDAPLTKQKVTTEVWDDTAAQLKAEVENEVDFIMSCTDAELQEYLEFSNLVQD